MVEAPFVGMPVAEASAGHAGNWVLRCCDLVGQLFADGAVEGRAFHLVGADLQDEPVLDDFADCCGQWRGKAVLAFAIKWDGLDRTIRNPDAKNDLGRFGDDLVCRTSLVGHDGLAACKFDLVAESSRWGWGDVIALKVCAGFANGEVVVGEAVLLGVLDDETEADIGARAVVGKKPTEDAGRFLGHEVPAADRSVRIDQRVDRGCVGLDFKPESAIDGADGAGVVGHLRKGGTSQEKYDKCASAAAAVHTKDLGPRTDLDCLHRWRSQRAPAEFLLQLLPQPRQVWMQRNIEKEPPPRQDRSGGREIHLDLSAPAAIVGLAEAISGPPEKNQRLGDRDMFGKTTALLAVVAATASSSAAVAMTTLYVPATYPTIQDAINASYDGDTILVSPGTYAEGINFGSREIDGQEYQRRRSHDH